jgi:hypothetical protein
MKPSLRRIIVGGTFALLVTFALGFTQKASAKPAGYTQDGLPYYYAYPDEGYSEESPAPSMDQNPYYFNYSNDELGYNEPAVDYYDSPWGWGWGWGWGVPFGFGINGFGFDNHRHHHNFNFKHGINNNFFARHNGFNKNFQTHSAIVAPHNSGGAIAGKGRVMNGGRVAMGGARGGGHGGGHR